MQRGGHTHRDREVGVSLPVTALPLQNGTCRPLGTLHTPWLSPGSSGTPLLLMGLARPNASSRGAQRPPALHRGLGRAQAGGRAPGRQ